MIAWFAELVWQVVSRFLERGTEVAFVTSDAGKSVASDMAVCWLTANKVDRRQQPFFCLWSHPHHYNQAACLESEQDETTAVGRWE